MEESYLLALKQDKAYANMKTDQQEEPLNVDKTLKRDTTREYYSKENCSRTILIMIQTYNISRPSNYSTKYRRQQAQSKELTGSKDFEDSSGKLVEIEYTLMAVRSNQISLGIEATNGLVIASEKRLPSVLIDEESLEADTSILRAIDKNHRVRSDERRRSLRKTTTTE